MNSAVNHEQDSAARQIKTLADSARALMEQGDLTSAEEIYRRILDVAPYHGPALSFFARIASTAGDNELALQLIDKAVKGNPGKIVHLLNRAKTYTSLGRLDEALRDLDAGLTLMPDHPAALFHKALVQRDIGDRKGAVKTAIRAWLCTGNPDALAADQGASEYLRAQVAECSNLIRSTQLLLIDSELEPIIDSDGKESLARVFAAVGAYAGLNGAPGPAQGLVFPELTEPPPRDEIGQAWHAALTDRLGEFRQMADGVLPLGTPLRGMLTRPLLPGPIGDQLASADLALPLASPLEDGFSLLLAPQGASFLNKRQRYNWARSVYLFLDVPGSAQLSCGRDTLDVKPGSVLSAGPGSEHTLHNTGDGALRLLRFDIWHPELSSAERAGLEGVFKAIRKFDSQYRQTAMSARV